MEKQFHVTSGHHMPGRNAIPMEEVMPLGAVSRDYTTAEIINALWRKVERLEAEVKALRG